MNQNESNIKLTLDAYLDGQLDPEQARTFEEKIVSNEKLRQDVELQYRIDRGLRAKYAPPHRLQQEFLAVIEPISPKTTVLIPSGNKALWYNKTLWYLAIAIGLVGIAAFIWNLELRQTRTPLAGEYNTKKLTEIYQQSVDEGFHPKWLCDDDHEFAQTFQRRQGQALVLKQLPEGSEMAGLAYLGGFSPSTTTLMCWVEKQPVMVFVDRVAWDEKPELVIGAEGLNVFRDVISGLVLYEVSPHDQPTVMTHLRAVSEPPPRVPDSAFLGNR